MLGKASPSIKHISPRACAGETVFLIKSGYLSLTARSLGLPILPFLVSIFLLGLGHHALGNLAPEISQGAGPLVVSMQEDNASSWSAPNLNATDGDIADTLTWSVSSAAANGIATISGSGSAPSTFTYVPNLNFFGSDSFVAQVSDGASTDSVTVRVNVIPGPSPIFSTSVNGAGSVPTQTVLAAVGSMTSVTSISAPVGTTPPFQLTATRGSMTDVSIRAGPVGTSPAFQLEGIAGSMGNLSVTTSVVASTPSFQITPVGGSMSSIQVVGPWSVFSYTGKGSGFFPGKAADISLIFLPNYPAIDGLFTSQTTTASVAGDGTLSFTIPAALQSGTHFISATPQWYHIPSASNLGSGYVQGFQPWVKVKRNGTELPTTGLNAVVATGIVGADGKVDITFTGNAVDDVNVTIEVEPVYEFDTMNFSGKGSNYHVSENGSSLSKPVITISPPSGGTNQTVDSTVAANGTLSFTLPSTTTKGGVHTISAAAGKYYQLPPVNGLGSGYASGVHPATTMTRNGDVLLALSSSVTAGADGKVDLTFSGNAGAGPLLVEVAPGSPAWVEGINSINVASAGTNYAVNDLITISGGGGTGVAAKVSSVGSGGEILSVSVVSQGTGFSSAPNATIAPPQKALHAPSLIAVASVSASRGQASAGKTIDWSGMSGVQGDETALQSNSRQHMWAPGNKTSWIQWDFGSLKTVGRMLVWQFNEAGNPNGSIKKAKLEYSEDGAHWTDFSVSGNWPKSSGAIDNHTVKSIDDLNFKARYVRLTGINSYHAGESQTGVSEVLFWSPKDAYIYTSSPSSGSANAFDDNTSSVWMPLQSALPNIYLAWQFTNPVQVNEYKIMVGDVLPEKRSPKSFKLQAFDIISSTWVDLASESNETGWTADELRAYSVDSPDFYINYKLLISAAEGVDTYLGLREIELWGGSGGSGAVLSASLTTVNTSPFVGQGSGYHPSENPTIRIPTPTGNDNNQTVTASVSANGKLTFTLPAPLEPEVYTISADLGTYYQLPAVFDRGSGYPSGHSPGVTFKRGDNAVAGMSGSATAAADGKVDSTFTGNAGSFTPVDVQILPGPLAFTPPSFSDQGSSKYDVSETPVVTITAPSSSTQTVNATVDANGTLDFTLPTPSETGVHDVNASFGSVVLLPSGLNGIGSGYLQSGATPSVTITDPLGASRPGTVVTVNANGTLNLDFSSVSPTIAGDYLLNAEIIAYPPTPLSNVASGFNPDGFPPIVTFSGVDKGTLSANASVNVDGTLNVTFSGAPSGYGNLSLSVTQAPGNLPKTDAEKIIAADSNASDQFGYSVSQSSDFIAVGAPGESSNAGAVYLYKSETNGSISYLDKAIAPDLGFGDEFGLSVSQSGDILSVGAWKADLPSKADAGATYLFRVEANGTVTYLQKVVAPDGAAGDGFGLFVSQSGNILSVGSYGADLPGKTDAGAVYLYRLESNGSITYLDKVIAPDGVTGDSFGQSLSHSGNILAVGAYKADLPGKADAGASYLYRVEANGTATYLTKLIAPDGGVGDTFGLSASQSGNILAIGACKADLPGKADAGATYLYRVEANGTATYLDKLLAPDGNAGDEFGLSVSQSGNILTVGASSVDVAATNVGAAYLFQLEANGAANFLEKLTAPDAATGNFFGHSVSQFGARLAVGSPFSDTSGKTDSGAAYVFRNRLWGNHKPVFSNASFAQFENNATSFFANATDLDPDDITAYSKSGPDAPLFTINVATGELYFTTPPDFENPVDSDGDNRYMVEITASDGISNTMQQFVVRVRNALEGSEKPSFVSVDLSGGTGASDYPVTYLNERPDDWNSSVYKTDKILLKWIAPGTFTMGQTGIENPFQVTQGVEFYIGVYETTGSQYAKVTGSDPSGKGGGMKPVENVSWEDLRGGVWPDGGPAGTSFLGKLRSKTSGAFFDLPTEAQWEYAARAGGATTFSHGDGNATLGDYAWYLANSGNTTHEVGLKLPNPWDLYDLHGNVWEWCLDWRSAYAGGAVVDPVGSKSGTERINRGGSYNGSSDWARLSHRGDLDPTTGDTTKGMRLVLNHSGRLTNRAPTDITASSTAVLELESVGALVGDFNASDPESNATHVFSLVQGSGSDQNNLFDIDANGTLTTKVVLGHEANATLSIRVRATDDYNASFDKVFAIEVLNVNETPVITQGASVSVVMDEDGDPLGWPLAWPSEDLNGTDPEGDVITWSLQTAPVHGTASVGGSGAKPTTFTYSPNPHYNGTDSFVVKLSDGLLSDSIIINVRINPRPENGLIPLAKSLTYDLQIPDANNFLFTGGGYSEAPDPDLVLMEGVNYRFSPKIGDHPFFIGSSAGVPYAGNELTGNGAEGPDGILSFIPNEDTPRQLVYYCASDGTMRGDIKIISARQNKLVRPNPRPGDQFGISMSVLGNQVLVGSNGESRNGLSNTGSAHLFERDLNGKWLPVQAFRASSPEAGGRLGRDVSLWHNLVVAGAPGHDSVAGLKGAAYVFEKNATSWSQAAKLSPSDGAIHDYFGQSVSARTNQVLVGAHMADPGGVSAAGAAYIFEKSGSGTWLEKTKLVPGDSLANGHYGVSVSLDGDLALVGASGSNNANGVSTGAAYLIGRTESDTWVQITKLTPDDGVANDQFGQSVKLDGDFSYVGARLRDEGGVQDTGAVYVFQRLSNGQWVQQAKITPENAGAEGYFGQSLDVRDNRLLVGAPGKIGDHAKSNPGYAYLFERDGIGNWTQKAKFVGYDGLSDDEMGFDVALGVSIFAGAPFRDDRGEDSGGAYVFDNSNWNDLPPVFSSEDDLTITMDEDGQPLAWVSPNVTASDPNGDVLSWRAYYENPSESNGTVVVFGTGASPETFQYRPKNDFHGTDTFTLEVSDGLYVKKLKVVVTVNGQVDEGEPVVRMMPGFLQSSLYANAKIGVPIAIWGSVENGVPPFDYSLDFGDGQSVQGSVTDARFVGMDHQYQTSGLKTAVLTITDSIGQVVKANTQVRVFLPSRVTLNETRNMAMERGLLYLYLNAVEDVQTNGLKWLDTKQETVYTTATTGFASMAFSGFGHSALTVSAVHAYGDVVRKALRYLTENEAVGMKDIPDHSDDGLAVRQSDDPTGKVPGKGVYLVETGGHDAYSNSIALLALLNSFPEGDKASETLVAGGPFVGWTYKEVAEEAMQLLFWTQGDDDTRGGWEYRLTQDQPQYDGSVQQWPVLALKTAQEKWGLNVPTWVKDNVDHAYATITNASGAVGYRSNSHWLNVAKTGGRLVSDAWMGRPSADPLAVPSITFISDRWMTSDGWTRGLYAAYGVKKGLSATGLKMIQSLEGPRDWDVDMASWLLGIETNLAPSMNPQEREKEKGFGQYEDGHWQGYRSSTFSTALALGILSRGSTDFPPMPEASFPQAVSAHKPFFIDGAKSYHSAPLRSIADWKWKWNWSGSASSIDWNTPDAVGLRPMHPGFTSTGQREFAMRVTDDGDPAKSSVKVFSILVSSGNHPAIPEPIPFSRLPVYSAKLNQKLVIDGGSSLDLDLYDSVTGYSWDINGTGVFQEGSRVIELRPYGHAFQGQVGLRVRDEDFTTWSDPKYVDLYVAEQDLNIVVMQVDPFNLQDSNFTIRLTVANDGNSSGVIQSPLVRFFDGNPVTVGTSLGVVPLPDLAPSGQGVASLTLPISSWTPQVFVFVDPYQRVPEWDESNNIGEFAIVPNYPPHDLSLTETNLLENQPAGTLAAKIHVLDVDDLNGTGSYHYELASGLSDVNNSGFYIQGNKLFSVRVFDYEERNLYNVRLRVYDDKNASFEKTLPVPVGNVDDHIPVLHLHGEQEVYHEAFDKYIDAGAYWTDAIDAGGVVVSTGTSVGQGVVDIGTPGPYQLYYDAVDSAGNEADRIFRLVTVRDTTKPNIFLQGLPEIALEAFSPYVDPGALWVDVLDGFGVVEANGTIDLSKPGTYVLRYNSTDAAGNVADEVTRTVVVSDTTPPVIQLNGTSALIHEVGQPYLDLGAIWTDAVDGNGTLMGVGWVDINTPGTYPLTYSFTDSSGNAALPVVRTVYALDRTSPIIAILGGRHLVMEAGTPYLDAGAIWLDAVDGNGSLQANETVNVNVPGTYVLSYEFVDAEGNVALLRTRTVTVMDTINPVISLTGESTVMHEAATPYVDAGAIWSDTLDGNGSVTASGSVNVNVLGTYLLTYDFKDASGNAAKQAKRMITVVDTTNPIIHLIEDQILTHEVLTAYVDPGAIWSDTLDGNGTLVASGSVKDSVSGTYFLTYNFVDAHGNAAVPVTRVVNVMDTTRPVITLTGNSSAFHEAGTPYTDFGATWLDAFDGSGSLVASGLVNENVPGTYLLSYDYTDAAGNAASRVIRTVAVVDTTSPVITLTGNPSVLHEAATAFKDSGAIVNNLVDGSISILGSGQMNVKIPGSYELTYDFTDAAGNPAKQVTRIVKVVDTTKPVISLVDGVDSVRVPLHMPFVVPELTAIDSVDGNLTSEIKERNDVNVDWPGVYESYIDVSDAAGNAAETVTVSVEVYNENPTGLHLLNDMVEENLPAGTLVGGLSTDDPNDVNGTHAYFYSMIDGGEMFSLSVDGFLRTKRPLDFEDQEVHLIKVSTTDMFDGRLEQVIEIRVVDAFTPIVETDVPVVNHSSNLLLLVGKVLDEGTNQGISEQGFVLGLQPDPKLDDPSSIVLWADRGAGRFELSPRNLLAGESYFYRAFASNTEGVGYGAQERFVAPIEPAGPAWANAEVSLSAPNWWISSWFGNFFLAENGWINHEALGWLYPTPSSENGVWFSQEKLGWMWTAPGIFPYMYVQNDASWHYFFGEVEGRIVFYRYGDGVWLDLTEGKGSQ